MKDEEEKINVVGYESPITVAYFAEQYDKQFNAFVDDSIMQAVRKVGIIVDKEELKKAINGERNQYSKGFCRGYDAGKRDLALTILRNAKNYRFKDECDFRDFFETLNVAFYEEEDE